jgi:hypothetical protein
VNRATILGIDPLLVMLATVVSLSVSDVGLARPAEAPRVWLAPAAPGPIEPTLHLRPQFEGQPELRLLVVGRGFTGPVLRYHARLRVLTREASFPNAWRFDPAGCRSGGASVRLTDSDRRVPPLSGARPYTSLIATFRDGEITPSLDLQFDALSEGVVAQPESIYVLGQFTFDFAGVRGGPSTPDSCGCASQVVGVQITSAWVEDALGQPVLLAFGVDCAGWNDDGTSDVCFIPDCSPGPCRPQPSTCIEPVPTPARSASWGRLKNAYRSPAR